MSNLDPNSCPQFGEQRVATARSAVRGFSLIDLLVSVAIVSVLIGIMLPSLSKVWESSRRVVCASNVRSQGTALQMYSTEYRAWLPPSVFAPMGSKNEGELSELVTLRLEEPENQWDGVGTLYSGGFLSAGGVFYCPSHWGEHPYEKYADRWAGDSGEIIGNFHFRAKGPDGTVFFTLLDPGVALIADSLRTKTDYSHRFGLNVLRADLSVHWFADPAGSFALGLPDSGDDIDDSNTAIRDAWKTLDEGTNGGNGSGHDR